MAEDPTMKLIADLADLADDSKWVTLERVAVFRAHERINEKGEVVYAVTDADLKHIAANTNANLTSSGQPVRLTIGHSDQRPDFPEAAQPELYGFAVGYKVERVRRPDGDFLALTQVEKIKPEYVERVKHLPYRSVEYKHDTKTINGCAALLRTPYLKLGAVVPYAAPSAGTSPPYHYSLGVPAVADTNDDDDKKKEEAEYATFAKRMKRYMAESDAEKAKEAAETANQSAQQKAIMASAVKDEEGDVLGWATEKQRKKDRGYAADADKELAKETANSAVGREVAYALTQIEALKATVAAERKALTVERTSRLLDPLKELVSFDESRELAYMAAMPSDADRAGHVEYMLKHYEKLPSGSLIAVRTPGAIGRGGSKEDSPLTRDEMYAAQDYRTKKGVSVEESHAHVKGLRK